VLYPVSYGPITYAMRRGWLPDSAVGMAVACFVPLAVVIPAGRPTELMDEYADWWADLGERHTASD
jgi:hypothetical protein